MSSSSPKGKGKITSGESPKASPSPAPEGSGKEVSQAAFQAAFAIAKILKDLSKKDQKSAMQMAGIQAGLSVTTQFAAIATRIPGIGVPSARGAHGGKRPPPQPKWGLAVKEKQSEIADLNRVIADTSVKLGRQLPADHDLIQRRDQLFRDLKGLKSKGRASQ